MNGCSSDAAGILLCGGASRRMGFDKTRVTVDGTTIVRRSADLLTQFVARAVEVGPGSSGLTATREEPAGAGPLAAVAAGVDLLRRSGHVGGALVIAGDLPRLSATLLKLLLGWPSSASVVPIVDGRAQPLCARWSAHDLDEAVRRAALGERSLRHVFDERDTTWLGEVEWSMVVNRGCFVDIDTPEDLQRFGLVAPRPATP